MFFPEILKIHLTLDNNILIIIKVQKKLSFKIYNLNLDYVISKEFDLKISFSSIIIYDDLVYFIDRQESKYYHQRESVKVVAIISAIRLEYLNIPLESSDLNISNSEHYYCNGEKLFYVYGDNIFENKLEKKSFM